MKRRPLNNVGHNAADCATRGLNKQELVNHFWWTGPAHIRNPPETWSTTFHEFDHDENSEKETSETSDTREGTEGLESPQKEQHVLLARKDELNLFHPLEKYSLRNVKRTVARILRFIRILVCRVNARTQHSIKLSSLLEGVMENNLAKISGTEIAGKILVKQHQLTTITPPLLQSLKHLNIKQDQNSLLRCYGRLGRSELSAESKNPMIVLQNSWLSQAIIQDCHEKGHPGIGHTMSIVREQVWIPKLRAQVTRTIRRCMLCQRFHNLPYGYPEQGDLPERRVLRSRPFVHVGLDYFGPLSISQPDGTDSKCYGSIITCMATRLIHLDVVSDLTTAAFLMMLRRFFGRRGLPNSITSDNAPTFALGETILKECLQAIRNYPTVQRAKDDIVLISEPIQPRQSWKMGRIQELVPNSEGIVREAIIVLPSRRQIRRPVNLLVPMELDDGQHCNSRKDESLSRDKSTTLGNIPATPTEGASDVEQSINKGQRTSRYNLRSRRQVNYKEFLTLLQMTNVPLILTVLLTM
ncbi:hypothetical protein ANCDUO_05356 [Ancylostoma duodenale]|uniref:Integrase catalytic domain-containing protein n=1 Tax=Ancylostoma duodenale TaxID=51022 RepID=A0A0C2GYV0_9BILA|nr:hypothetical protein ANCDUO_05356 [Ancylostoma duodenale]